ncbi:O183 family O-antigen flippase [Escherichia coli]
MSIFNNLKWNAISQLFKIATQLISMIYLARLIAPEDYGIMAMATVVTNFAILFRDLGTSAAIVQRDSIDESLKSAIFWLNLLLGIIVGTAILFSSSYFSELYDVPKLKPVLSLLSINFFLLGATSVHLSLLERESKFETISKIEIFSFGSALIIAIAMAYLNFGVYSLVTQSIVSTLLSSGLFWYLSSWSPRIKIENIFKNTKSIFSFSYQLSLFNFINYFARNLDSFLIGKYMSATILGAYNLAYRIMLFPLTSITFIVNRSLFPILSKNKYKHAEVEKIYLNTVYTIWFITIPLIISLLCLNEMVINIIFGEKWHLSSSILVWLAPTAIIQSILSTTGIIFMSQGRTGILVLLGVQGAILTGIAFVIGVNDNITSLAKYYFIANLVHFFPCMALTMYVIKSNFYKLILKTYPLFIAGFISYCVIYILKKHLDHSFLSLVILTIICFVVFIVSLLPTKEVKNFINRLIK